MSKSIRRLVLAGLGGFAALTASITFAAERTGYYGYGKPATTEEIAGWDIDVRPDGQGLPPGSGSVLTGERLYEEKCSVCHGYFGEGQGRWPVLAGGFDTLTDDRPEKTVGSYWPYASTLWDYIHRAMPFFNPQSLSTDEVYAITAYVLYLNDLVDEEFVLTQDNLVTIEMPNRNGFFRDDRPDTHNTACMENCKDPNDIKITWDATELGVTPTAHFKEAETQTLPTETEQPGEADASTGADVYAKACVMCHGAGVAGVPQTGDKNAWLKRIAQGIDVLVDHAVNGYRGKTGYMPPKGGNTQLSDAEVAAAVGHIIEQSAAKDTQL